MSTVVDTYVLLPVEFAIAFTHAGHRVCECLLLSQNPSKTSLSCRLSDLVSPTKVKHSDLCRSSTRNLPNNLSTLLRPLLHMKFIPTSEGSYCCNMVEISIIQQTKKEMMKNTVSEAFAHELSA